MAYGLEEDGTLWAEENGERVDELRAVEIYAALGGAIGWPIVDAMETGFRGS